MLDGAHQLESRSLVQFLAAGAEFGIRRRPDAGCFVHDFLPGVLDGLDWYFAYRFPGLDTIPKIAMAGIAAGSRTAAVTTPVLDAGGTKPAADRSPAHLAGSRPRDQTTGRGPADCNKGRDRPITNWK